MIGRYEMNKKFSSVSSQCNNHGFTLIELITVLIIASVLAVVGMSRFVSNQSFKEAQVQQELLSALRYAQKIAIASQCPVKINLTPNSYRLTYGSPCSGSVKKPATQNSYSVTSLPATISSSSGTFSFNASGNISPASGGTISIGQFKIILEPVSGFAHD